MTAWVHKDGGTINPRDVFTDSAVFFPDFFHKKMEKFAIFGVSPPLVLSTSLPWLFEPGVEHHPAISPGQNRAADMG